MVYLKYLAVILHKIAQICTCYVINGLKLVIYRLSTSGHNCDRRQKDAHTRKNIHPRHKILFGGFSKDFKEKKMWLYDICKNLQKFMKLMINRYSKITYQHNEKIIEQIILLFNTILNYNKKFLKVHSYFIVEIWKKNQSSL